MTPPAKPRRRGPDWWVCAAVFFLLLQLAFFVVPHVRPGYAGMWMWLFGGDSLLWKGLAALLLVLGFVWSLIRRPFWSRWRAAGVVLLILLALSPNLFWVYPSSHEGRVSEVRFRLPLDGPVTVAWGGDSLLGNYHVSYPDQRWAYDLLVTKDGKSYRGDGTELTDYYCYGMPVLAPADGVVVYDFDGDPDVPVGQLGAGTSAGGNEVAIEVAPGEYLVLSHLQPGSITVKVGDRVTAGQAVGKVGNSGNTSEPHLHVHLQDAPPPELGEGIPLYFYDYRVNGQYVERGMPTGGVGPDGWAGQVVEHAGAAPDPPDPPGP
jgi:hypothetical protein